MVNRAYPLADDNRAPFHFTSGDVATATAGESPATVVYDAQAVHRGHPHQQALYSLRPAVDDNNLFSIDPTTGAVTFNTPPSYHPGGDNTYDIVVTAHFGGQRIKQVVEIKVTDVAPTTPVDANPAPNIVAEGAPAGTAVGLTASSTDAAGEPITYSLTADNSGGGFAINPTTGVVTVANPSKIDYVPSGGSFDVTVQATDAAGASAPQTFKITVDPGSTFSYGPAPVVAKGGSAGETPSVSSPEGGDHFALGSSGTGTYGTASVNASTGVVSYTASGAPAAGTTATDSFTITDTDAYGAQTHATASFTVDGGTAFAYAPTAVTKGGSASETPSVTSPEGGDQFVLASSGTGTYGTASVNATTGVVTYTASGAPAAGTAGTDSFTIVDTDRDGAQTSATASFTVDGGTAFAYGSAAVVASGHSASDTPTVTSPEGGDNFAFAPGTSGTGAYGTASVNATTGVVTYTASSAPVAGTTATQSFTIVDTDRDGAQTSATASFTVDGGTAFSYPAAPAVAKGGSTSETPTVTSSPEGGDSYAFAAGGTSDAGTYGTATVNASTGAVSYAASSVPAAGTTATDSFTIVDTDPDGAKTSATATFTVDGGTAFAYGAAPVLTKGESGSDTPTVTSSPEGGDSYAFAPGTSGTGTYGTAMLNATTGVVSYTATSAPTAGTAPTDSFTIVDTDADGAKTSATASFTVDGGSAVSYGPPVVVKDGGSASDTATVISPEGGDSYAFAPGTSGTGTYGTATLNAATGVVSYTATSAPAAGSTETDSFTVVDTDKYGVKTDATATFTVDGGTAFSYGPPQPSVVANGNSASDTPTVTSSPEGGDTYAFAPGYSGTGTYGTATVNATTGVVTYTATKAPAAGTTATDSFTIADTDKDGAQTDATATFTVDGGTAFLYPTAPAVAKGVSIGETPAVTSSPEGGDSYAFAAGGTSDTGTYGTATVDASTGSVTYTPTSAPAAGTTAKDSFTVVDTDKDGARRRRPRHSRSTAAPPSPTDRRRWWRTATAPATRRP